eukprot:65379-Chlamydomonas_euryale.AAC.1
MKGPPRLQTEVQVKPRRPSGYSFVMSGVNKESEPMTPCGFAPGLLSGQDEAFEGWGIKR